MGRCGRSRGRFEPDFLRAFRWQAAVPTHPLNDFLLFQFLNDQFRDGVNSLQG
jgi:hypothetical protein